MMKKLSQQGSLYHAGERMVPGLLQSRSDWLIKSNAQLGEGYSDIVICTPDKQPLLLS